MPQRWCRDRYSDLCPDRAGTGTFTLIFDLGYEFDGARRVNDGALEVDGDDGEPFTGTYEFTLDVSLSTENGSSGNPVAGIVVLASAAAVATAPQMKGVAEASVANKPCFYSQCSSF